MACIILVTLDDLMVPSGLKLNKTSGVCVWGNLSESGPFYLVA